MDRTLEPNPARGVFSTLLVVDGRPVALDSHLARLRESVGALYGVELPAEAAALVAARAHGLALGRVRLECRVDAHGAAQLEAHASAVDRTTVQQAQALALRATPVDGWHGAHKWIDRRLLDRLQAAAAPASALLVERDGRVLETTRANVFALGEDGVLRTPPTDGSILPGVTRAWALAVADELGVTVRQEPLSREMLRAAREVFATGSVRGVQPVRSLDDAPIGGGGASALAGELCRRWLRHAGIR
jgi:branched-subunit amino acid aminotransferase/4-amino-4-deoxychorismate lyase